MASNNGSTTAAGSSAEGEDEESRPARMAFLALIMLAAGAGNVLLLYAVLRSKKLRHSVQNVVVVTLAAVCLADCICNMFLVMGSLSAGDSWQFGDALCRWHSFLMNLVLVETALLLVVLTGDRYVAVRFLQRYDTLLTPRRLAVTLTFTWLQSLAFSIPFLFDTVYTTFRPRLHTCSVSDQTPLAFIVVASVLCFLAPMIAIIVLFVLIFRLAYKQRHEVRTLKTQTHYTDVLMEEPRLTQEMWTVKLISVLFLLWFILELPYIITTYIQQYRLSKELSFSVEYPWGVDIAFIWMRFSYSAVIPCAIFMWKRQLWNSLKECVTCHRNNSVIDIVIGVKEPSKPVREMSALSIMQKTRDRDQKQEPPSVMSFNVPVLFATSDGIHIESSDRHHTEPDPFYTEILSRTRLREIALQKGRQLDVGDTIEEDQRLPDDTSDYASSSEGGVVIPKALSDSHEKVSESEENAQMSRTPQQSHTKTGHMFSGSPQRVCSNGLSGTQGIDSGLELSGTAGSTMGKGIRNMMESSQIHNCNTHQRDNDLEHVSVLQSNVKQNHVIVGLGQTDEGHQETQESPSILSPSTHVVPVWDTSPRDKSVVLEETSPLPSQTEQSAPPSLPKAPGRLKPLPSDRKRKAKKLGLVKKKKSPRETSQLQPIQQQQQQGTSVHDESPPQGDELDKQESSETNCSENKIKTSHVSSKGNGRGHKRTKTSDSQKSLLGSNSSVELQNLKAQGQRLGFADGEHGNGTAEKEMGAEPSNIS